MYGGRRTGAVRPARMAAIAGRVPLARTAPAGTPIDAATAVAHRPSTAVVKSRPRCRASRSNAASASTSVNAVTSTYTDGSSENTPNTRIAVPMMGVRLDLQCHMAPAVRSESEQLRQAYGDVLDPACRLGVVERHRLEGPDRRDVLGTRHAGVEGNLHGLGLGQLPFDISRQQVIDERLAPFLIG